MYVCTGGTWEHVEHRWSILKTVATPLQYENVLGRMARELVQHSSSHPCLAAKFGVSIPLSMVGRFEGN